ncbi:MAG: pantoate--beta-alanine ligase [Flavobacteriales bacterium]|nr:pantoate--beta-alanine ligase [Flavobacteriales bacterium]
MKVITTVNEMALWSDGNLSSGRTIGLVPTMGALHSGHISLVNKALSANDLVVVSVFVNPIQFNSASDLDRYPRTFDADSALLGQAGVDVMFFPSVKEVYPAGGIVEYDLEGLDEHMEGPNRPGHFNGVVQVVTRLFDIVKPNAAYFGEKDFQQLAIIRHAAAKLGYGLNVVGCPTVREEDGLAKSSRNALLTDEFRQRAPVIFEVLEESMGLIAEKGIQKTKAHAMAMMTAQQLRPEYFELVRPDTLQPVTDDWDGPVQACVAAWAGEVRLIDNLRVK